MSPQLKRRKTDAMLGDSDADDAMMEEREEREEREESEESESECECFDAEVATAAVVARFLSAQTASVSSAQLCEAQTAAAREVAAVVRCTAADAAVLLREFRWNKDRLFDRFYEDTERVCSSAGVGALAGMKDLPTPAKVHGFECPVCYSDDPTDDTLALSCGHRFCISCYRRYLEQKICQEGASRHISCCQSGCGMKVGEQVVSLLVGADVQNKFRHLLSLTYVEDIPSLKWCPAPDCDFAVECKDAAHSIKNLTDLVPSVTCACGNSFCFGCSLADHRPTPCGLIKLWLRKCADDSETSNWICANTKECPRCQTAIEKNGGCNHMKCYKCQKDFCWICPVEWTSYSHQCSKFLEEPSETSKTQSRSALQRYLHYFTRFANHEQSAKLDAQLSEKIATRMLAMQDCADMSWIEAQFLARAKGTLLAARNTLKWTYCLAFYLDKGSNRALLFEDNQADLEGAVEALSGLLESEGFDDPQKVPELRKNILDKAVYVGKRRDVLLEAAGRDLVEGKFTWQFDESTARNLKASKLSW